MTPLLDKKLIYVTGKGGVGRSTVAAALGLASARRGRRTVIVEVAEQDRLSRVFRREGVGAEESELAENLWAVSIDPHEALREWLSSQLGSRALVKVLFDNSAFTYFIAAAPGARELVTITKAWELTQTDRWKKGASGYDLVIVDAPASGHGLAMLKTPKTFGDIARVGPIRKQADRVGELLSDRRRTGYLAVALPEEMPVNETLELEAALRRDMRTGFDAVVVNGMHPRRFSPADAKILSDADADQTEARAAVRSARTEQRRQRTQQNQLARLRRGAKAPVMTLPFLFEPELGLEELEGLADELAIKL